MTRRTPIPYTCFTPKLSEGADRKPLRNTRPQLPEGDPAIQQVTTITLPALHTHRWTNYVARRVHHATAAGGNAKFLPALRELHQLLYQITETKLPEYTINIPNELLPYCQSYSYVARRLP